MPEKEFPRLLEGKKGKYPQLGYFLNFPRDHSISDYLMLMQEAILNDFLHPANRIIAIGINLLSKNDGKLIFVELILEQQDQGFQPSETVITFDPL